MPILHGESNRRNKRTRNKMSLKIDMTDLRVDNSPAHNSGLAKVAVSFSADSFEVNQTLVLRINICGENRHLRQAPNR